MKDKATKAILTGLRKAFLDARSVSDLCELLDADHLKLTSYALNPSYNVFEIRKKSGKMRLIEDPAEPLQQIQDTINDYLQAVYWHQRSPAAYGFVINVQDDPTPRHIETNAALHLNRPWLLNCDLLDFFHQVTYARVKSCFSVAPFKFQEDAASLLAGLCTYKGRCPMGAPTSPVLSNLVFAAVDADLIEFSHKRGWKYSRYADDMSFSSQESMNWDDYTAIKRIVTEKHDYAYNEEKAMLFGPEDTKVITGLLLTPDGLEVPSDFLPNLMEDIRQLEASMKVQYRAGFGKQSRANERFQRSVEGKLQFYRRIMGAQHKSVAAVSHALTKALAPPTELEARSWLDFDYF